MQICIHNDDKNLHQNDERHVDMMIVAFPSVIKRLQDWNDNLKPPKNKLTFKDSYLKVYFDPK